VRNKSHKKARWSLAGLFVLAAPGPACLYKASKLPGTQQRSARAGVLWQTAAEL
jgi:hypothetical protein